MATSTATRTAATATATAMKATRTAAAATTPTKFVPRTCFPPLDSLPRSYFLGHHRAGLTKMNTMLTQIDLIIECRDYRVPLTSRNPLFEQSLSGRERIIIYTKRDLGEACTRKEAIIRAWHAPSPVLFSNHKDKRTTQRILDFSREYFQSSTSLTGSRVMVVGMPNVGKSSLLNALRKLGVGKGKAASTGAQPGVTRKISTSVKILDGDGDGEGVYLLDTPGVFVPYVPDSEAMVKLALCGSVKDTILPPTSLVDYLLYRINLVDPLLYKEYSEPTNDVMVLLEAVAKKTGRLQKGGEADTEATALWVIQRWRNGHLGRFLLDEVEEGGLERKIRDEGGMVGSLNQARKVDKEGRRQRQRTRHASGGAGGD